VSAQSDYRRTEKEAYLASLRRMAEEIFQRKECLSLKELAVSGRDLIADGMKPGREMGVVLDALLTEVLEEPSRNTREFLLERSRTLRE
jgi:tRNA nucleotidyltransferase (CCA-adding enzyme)